MKGGGGGGAGTPGDAGGPPGRRRTLSFVLIVFTSFFICIPFILCFQCVFDLYFFLSFLIRFLRVASALRGLLKNEYWFYVFLECKKTKKCFFLKAPTRLGKIYVIDLAIWKRFVQELASNSIRASSYGHFFPRRETWSQCSILFFDTPRPSF